MNDLKNVKQVLRRPMTLLVTLYRLTIRITYNRAGFTYKSLRNYVQKTLCIFLTPYTHLVGPMSTPLIVLLLVWVPHTGAVP